MKKRQFRLKSNRTTSEIQAVLDHYDKQTFYNDHYNDKKLTALTKGKLVTREVILDGELYEMEVPMTQPQTFLSEYAKMMTNYETPEIYDLWAAMATLASTVSRKVWFDLGNIRIFPNLYIVLVGPPGARKNTAMMYSQELLEALGDVPMVQGAITKEKLVEFMSTECRRIFFDPERHMETEFSPLTIFSNELTHFLGTDSIKAIHMVDFMTLIYDKVGDYEAGTVTRGDNIVYKPCINLFSATTPSNIARYLKEEALSGGMARRTVFVNANRAKTPIAIPRTSEEAKQAKSWCLQFLEQVNKVSGPFTLPLASEKWYIKWYDDVFEKVNKESNDLIGGYLSSKHIQMFKLAMLNSLNRSLTDKAITIEDMVIADALLTKVEAELPIVYEGLGVNEQASVANMIKHAVMAAGGKMSDREIRLAFFKSSKDLPKIMEHLQDTQTLVCMASKKPDGTTANRTWYLWGHQDAVRARGGQGPADEQGPASAASGNPQKPPGPTGGRSAELPTAT